MSKHKAKPSKLTEKQVAFIAAYEGNGTEACRLAGYRGSDNVLAQQARDNLSNPQIAEAIRTRSDAANRPLIASRERRQKFWTTVMDDEGESMKDRLRASELLAKSQGDFIDKHELSVTHTLADLVAGSNEEEKD